MDQNASMVINNEFTVIYLLKNKQFRTYNILIEENTDGKLAEGVKAGEHEASLD